MQTDILPEIKQDTACKFPFNTDNKYSYTYIYHLVLVNH